MIPPILTTGGDQQKSLIETLYVSKKIRISPRFYKIFDPAVTKEGVDAVSVSLESSRRGSAASHPGRAVLARFAFSVLLSAWTNSFVFVFETHPCLEEISSID